MTYGVSNSAKIISTCLMLQRLPLRLPSFSLCAFKSLLKLLLEVWNKRTNSLCRYGLTSTLIMVFIILG